MLPIILLTDDKKESDKFIANIVKQYQIRPTAVFSYYKEKTAITINQIRELTNLFSRVETQGQKLIVINDFHTAKAEAQNALLKTLEEKAPQAQFILIVSNQKSILPTILSRSRIIRLKKTQKNVEEFNEFDELAKALADLSDIEKNPQKAINYCDKLLFYFRKKLLVANKEKNGKSKAPEILKEIIRVRNFVDKNNLNPQLAADHLVIFIKSIMKNN